MTDVADICQTKFFSLDTANKLVPLLKRITENSENRIKELLDKQRYFITTGASKDLVKKCDTEVGEHLVKWGSKITKLGAVVFIDGYVGLDAGTFFWSWHQGDKQIEYYHNYTEPPSMRRPLSLIQGLL